MPTNTHLDTIKKIQTSTFSTYHNHMMKLCGLFDTASFDFAQSSAVALDKKETQRMVVVGKGVRVR